MKTVLYAAPTEYPVSMLEIKDHLRIDSGTLEDTLTATQCMAYGSHAIANDYVTHVGTAVEVLGKEAVIVMNHGTNGATGTVDTIVQHSHGGRDLCEVGAHCAGHNAHSVGICMIGTDQFTADQWDSLAQLVNGLAQVYPIKKVLGHHDHDPNKTCPCFDVEKWWAKNQIHKVTEETKP